MAKEPETTLPRCPTAGEPPTQEMAPPKSQRASDFFRQCKGGKQRMEQDGRGSRSPTHSSDAGSDTDSRQVTADDLSVSEKHLGAMLQDLHTSMKTDFQAAVSDMRKDIHEVDTGECTRRKN
ncbi:Hypothetical predicted protein [Pelobates cultripes]|uniref:Uncharacterized protein n=1 Tax=Pelobates cultripes TaxID=61616 RepID=A0AAD1VQF3_PELCU|nr:Hypothetical predicted protein [Pelobates cultripes]